MRFELEAVAKRLTRESPDPIEVRANLHTVAEWCAWSEDGGEGLLYKRRELRKYGVFEAALRFFLDHEVGAANHEAGAAALAAMLDDAALESITPHLDGILEACLAALVSAAAGGPSPEEIASAAACIALLSALSRLQEADRGQRRPLRALIKIDTVQELFDVLERSKSARLRGDVVMLLHGLGHRGGRPAEVPGEMGWGAL